MKPQELGVFGEKLAVKSLMDKKYKIIERNYRKGRGEIDIISMDGATLVITEVKTRNSEALGAPYSSVSRKKQAQLIKLTNTYVKEHNINEEIRFDIISIVHNQYRTTIEHIERAFYPIA